jgi:hypothetical protein
MVRKIAWALSLALLLFTGVWATTRADRPLSHKDESARV